MAEGFSYTIEFDQSKNLLKVAVACQNHHPGETLMRFYGHYRDRLLIAGKAIGAKEVLFECEDVKYYPVSVDLMNIFTLARLSSSKSPKPA